MWKIFCLTLLLLIFCVSSESYNYQSDRVLLTEIKALTLRRGLKTTGRRSSPVDQLHCVGGSAAGSNHHPDVVQCVNVGNDGFEVQWDCKADLESDVKFGSISVTCEGYDNPNDPYILKGSCGLEYNLEYTKKGQGNHYQYDNYGDGYYDSYTYQEGRSGWSSFFTFIILVVVIYLILRACASPTGNTPYGGGGYGTGYGYGGGPGGGGGPGFGPYNPGCAPSYGYSSGGYGGGGFWTGLAAGGLLSSLFRPSYGTGYGGYRRGLWGSGGGYGGYRPSFGGGGGSRMASGFGGTSRR